MENFMNFTEIKKKCDEINNEFIHYSFCVAYLYDL